MPPLPDDERGHKLKSVEPTDEAEAQTANNVIPNPILHEPGGPCPLHPTSNHKWSECHQYKERSVVREGALTFDPTATTTDQDHPEPEASDPKAELLRWHYRLGHLPFFKLKLLASKGEIPKHLAKIAPPKCAGCLFGAMAKIPWKTQNPDKHIFVATKPGECVSEDQMISTQVGFVAQLKGKLTKRRYRALTVFVDHYSRIRYVHHMSSLTSEETV